MRATLWVVALVLAAGVLGLAGDGSVAWPGADGTSFARAGVSCASPPPWTLQGLHAGYRESAAHLSDDDVFFPCYFIGCACESNMRACCREMCCHWTCELLPSWWLCTCYYRTTCYWVPNCYTSPVLPMRVGPVGGEL